MFFYPLFNDRLTLLVFNRTKYNIFTVFIFIINGVIFNLVVSKTVNRFYAHKNSFFEI